MSDMVFWQEPSDNYVRIGEIRRREFTDQGNVAKVQRHRALETVDYALMKWVA